MSTGVATPASVTRNELYDLVWSEPMTKVAPRFGLSDVGLAKVCKRYDIPRPPMGYWAKKEFGKAPDQTPLPPIEDAARQKIEFLVEEKAKPEPAAKRKVTDLVQDEDLKKLIEFELRPENQIVVNESPSRFHDFVRTTKAGFTFEYTDRQGLYRPSGSRDGAHLDISVSKDSLPRALRFMDALIKAFEKRRHKVIVNAKERDEIQFVIRDERLTFRLREKTKMIRLSEAERKTTYETVRYEPTGLLELQLWRKQTGYVDTTWKETPTIKLEEQLNRVMIAMIIAVENDRDWRRQREAEARQQRENEIKRWQEAQERRQEEKKIEELNQMVQNWDQAARIRDFINDVRSTTVQRQGPIDDGSDLANWMEWALKHADRIDPLGAERIKQSASELNSCWSPPGQPR